MQPAKDTTDPSVRLTFLEAIDPVCVAFEVTCQETGRPPRIEVFIDGYDFGRPVRGLGFTDYGRNLIVATDNKITLLYGRD